MRFEKKTFDFFFISGEDKILWKNCLEVQEHAHRRVMDMDGVLISCKNKQGWIINHLQYVLALFLCFITTVFPDSLELWRFVQFCQILTFSKSQNFVLIKIALYKKISQPNFDLSKILMQNNLSEKSPVNKKLQSQELVYF